MFITEYSFYILLLYQKVLTVLSLDTYIPHYVPSLYLSSKAYGIYLSQAFAYLLRRVYPKSQCMENNFCMYFGHTLSIRINSARIGS